MSSFIIQHHNEVLEFWQSSPIRCESDVLRKLDSYRILFAYNSNKIENQHTTYYDTREIFENGKVTSYTGDLKTLFEIQNQKNCFDFLVPKICEKEPISIPLIKEMHKILTAGTYDERRYIVNEERYGEFKKHDYVTGKNETGTPPEYVDEDMNGLVKEILDIESYEKFNALTVATYLHASFEFIHPFADGNGRVGRTLMNYYLMIHDHPPLIVYDEDKNNYYEALEKFDMNENIDPLKEFFKGQTVKTWKKSIERTIGRDNALKSGGLIDITKRETGRK